VSIENLRQAHPGLFLLSPDEPASLEDAMRKAGLLAADESVSHCSRAGEGNMNCTVRVKAGNRSFILKQSRPWVEKYPGLAAPWDRVCREWEFYGLVQGVEGVADRMPAVLHFDAGARCMALEDLGEDGDYTDLFRGATLDAKELETVATFLGRLHRMAWDQPGYRHENREMRALNHAHVFEIPFRADNGLDLESVSTGLAVAGALVHQDVGLAKLAADLGREVYLADGPTLLHGDFFPGSLVRTSRGPYVIDPEFGFHGRAEFDVGVWLGHLVLAGQPEVLVDVWRPAYRGPTGFVDELALRLAGIEIVRRLIGYAQLPLGCTPRERIRRLEVGIGLMQSPTWSTLREGLVDLRSREEQTC